MYGRSREEGACWAACVASILGIDLDHIPIELRVFATSGAWQRAWHEWLKTIGYRLVEWELDDWPGYAPDGLWIGAEIWDDEDGEETGHATVWRGRELVWNPARGERVPGMVYRGEDLSRIRFGYGLKPLAS